MSIPEIHLSENGQNYVCDGQEFTRVTQIIKKVLPPYLAPWAEKVGQHAAFQIFDMGGRPDSPEELTRMIRDAGLTCEEEKNRGADRGQALHQAIEAMILTGEPTVDLHDFDDPEHRLYAQSFSQFMLDYRPVFERSEVRIVHPELGYAGTLDAIGKLTARPKGARGPDVTGQTVVFDFKTNLEAKVYEQHLFQLAAYELALARWDVPVRGSVVVAVGPSGQTKKKTPYTVKVNHVQPEAFEGIMAFWELIGRQAARNPLGRKRT